MIDTLKKTSLEFFHKQGYPTKKLENWKFTSSKNFKKFSKKEISDISIANISTDETTLLFINGKLCLNTFKNFRYRDNIEINELANIEEKAILTFSDTFMNDAMFNLGMSEFDGGHYIKFKKQTNVEDPIKIVNLFQNDTSDRRIVSFNIFHFEEGSQISIVEKDINEGAPSFNLKMNKFICDNASNLNFAKYVEGKSDCHLLSYSYYKVGKDVCLNMDSMNKDAIFSKEFIEIDLNNTGSDAKVNILNLVKDEQHLDNNILINHNAEHCTSFQHVRNILDNKSSTVFNGKVIVAEGAQQTDSNQSNKNLLLSLNSTAFSNPQLEIYADDVSCGHGSTTGALDENSIFYLRARGIDQSSAQKMLIKAFAKEVINEFSLSSVQDISEIALDRWIDG